MIIHQMKGEIIMTLQDKIDCINAKYSLPSEVTVDIKDITPELLSAFSESVVKDIKVVGKAPEDCSGLFSLRERGYNHECTFLWCRCIDLSELDMSEVTDMSYMFLALHHVKKIEFGNNTLRNVRYMQKAFWGCRMLSALDMRNVNDQCLTNMNEMFRGCVSLESVNNAFFDKLLQEQKNKKRTLVINTRKDAGTNDNKNMIEDQYEHSSVKELLELIKSDIMPNSSSIIGDELEKYIKEYESGDIRTVLAKLKKWPG